MAVEVSVTTDPLLVYGMVGLLLGALVLALLFSRPRRGLGAINRSDVPEGAVTDEPWMPTGDIFGHDGVVSPPPPPASPTLAAQLPAVPTPSAPPAAPTPSVPPAVHDPWSTGASGQRGAPPPWGKR